MKLYKYRPIDDYTKNSLSKSYLYFSKPSSLNDPFEFGFKLDMSGTKEEISQFIKELFLERKPSFRALPRNKRRGIIKNSTKTVLKDNIDWGAVSRKMKVLMDKFSVCSFSTISDNILMWSHYADKHKGLCLEFDSEELGPTFFKKSWIEQITYQKDLPIVRRVKIRDPMAFLPVFKTKSDYWEYENEVRIINELGNDKVEFEKRCLKGIIFGQGTSKKLEDEISTLIATTGYDVRFYKAMKDDSTYSLKVKNY